MLPDPVALGLVPKKFSVEKIINNAEIYQWRWLKESGLWLENEDRTHLVLASARQVLHKSYGFTATLEGLDIT